MTIDKSLEKLYEIAINKWGMDAQMMMVIEEMSELIKEICKSSRNGIVANHRNLIDEYVDVMIMLEQLEVMLSSFEEFDFEKVYTEYRTKKMTRLRVMLED